MSAAPQRYLTGITTSGTPHLGNYVGAIRPTVRASLRSGTENFYFLADYHALIKCDDPQRVQRSTMQIGATWLAAGLDPDRVVFYRQSDIPEIPVLTWMLACVAGKGLLNRAHAYKAAVDKNAAAGLDGDADVTVGLYMYPVLMAADILMFNPHWVPVGRDQVQHIEMTRDMAASFNHLYGEHFVLPQAAVDEDVPLLPGLDGRKMSKSYGNVIELLQPSAQLRKQVASIVTDSRAPGEPKPTEGSGLFQLYQGLATAAETRAFAQAFAEGIAWADAKQMLFELIEREVAPMRERYEALMANPTELEAILQRGGEKARDLSAPLMARLRSAVGLRSLASSAPTAAPTKTLKAALPQFKQYRDADGRHYFKFQSADGRLLLQSQGFESPRDAGRAVAQLKQGDASAVGDQCHLVAPATAADLADALAVFQAD